MEKKSFIAKLIPYGVGAVLGFILGVIFLSNQMRYLAGNATEASKFLYALGMVRKYFVGEIDDVKLYRGAISGILGVNFLQLPADQIREIFQMAMNK